MLLIQLQIDRNFLLEETSRPTPGSDQLISDRDEAALEDDPRRDLSGADR